MISKKSKFLILCISFLYFSVGFPKTVIYKPAWKPPEIKEDHGPFYSDTQLGLVVQGGNTIDNTIAFNTVNSLVSKVEIFQLGGHYNYGWDESGLSSRNWDARFRYQRIINPHFNPFGAIVFEGDPFSGLKDRANFDLGVTFPFKGYIFSWDFELGYRYSAEQPTEEVERYQNKIRLHLEGKWNFGKTGEISLWGRYMPFLSDTQGELSNYMFDYGTSIASYFTERFYLNLSFIGNYREIPLEERKQDDYRLIGSVGFKI